MSARAQQLRGWAEGLLVPARLAWSPVSGDASARRYFRVADMTRSWIAVDAPPETEDTQQFVQVHQLLAGNGIRVPSLLHVDLAQGFMLQEDLGSQLLLGSLNDDSVDAWYRQALDLMLQVRQVPDPDSALPRYSRAILEEELSRFTEWCCGALLQLQLSDSEQRILAQSFELLVSNAEQQPVGFVHVDFHSRNLLPLASGELALIDFQDARWGPLTYDLVSLLKDCYISWPRDLVRRWALQYRDRLVAIGIPAGRDEAEFLRWFDWMGLQRHIKVLGNFSRLAIRDNKPGYLADMPLVLGYCLEALAMAPEHAGLYDFFQHRLQPALEPKLAALMEGAPT